MTEKTTDSFTPLTGFYPTMVSIGHLGAAAPESMGLEYLKEERLSVIEKRILRIEQILRDAGLPIDQDILP